MKAILLILVPMLVLAGVMTAVFWLAGEPPAPSAPAAGHEEEREQAATPTAPVPAPASKEAPDRLAESPAGGATKQVAAAEEPAAPPAPTTASAKSELGAAAAEAADAVDDWVNIARTRMRRDRQAQLKRAQRAYEAGRPAEGLAACNEILAAHPEDVDALSLKAACLVRLKRVAEALGVYAYAIERRPGDYRLRYNYAVALSRLKRFGEAIRQYQAVLRLKPDHLEATHNLARILQNEGKLTEASELWRRVTETRPDDPDGWFNRGVVALGLGEYETAVTSFRRADKLQPGRADTCTDLGLAYQKLGRLPEAVAAFQRAREADPEYLPAVNGIAELYLDFYADHAEAADHLDCGLKWCEYSLAIQANQGWLRRLFDRALKLRPDSVRAMNGLARVLAATPKGSRNAAADRARALELCRRSLEANADQADIVALERKLLANP